MTIFERNSNSRSAAPESGSSVWFWACVSLMVFLSVLLLTFWIPVPGLKPPSEDEADSLSLLRIRDLLGRPGNALLLPIQGAVGEEGREVSTGLDAERFRALRLEGQGEAEGLVVTWTAERKDGGERRREISVPLDPKAEGQQLTIPVATKAGWRGRINSLEIRSIGGSFVVDSLEALLPETSGLSLGLDGLSMPAFLAGNRYVVELPAVEGAVFEGAIGLLQGAVEMEGEVRFRAVLETPAGPEVWVDETLTALATDGAPAWHELKRQVSIPPESRLRLEVSGDPALQGRAFWGNPLLVRASGRSERRPAQRDVIVVVIDTLRADVLGSYGSTDGLTPNLDRLASRGLVLEDLRAPAPWTLPSVASLFTGLSPAVHGAGTQRSRAIPLGLPTGFETLAEILGAEDFYTAGVFNNVFLSGSMGLGQGFDRYDYVEAGDRKLVNMALEVLEGNQDRRLFLFLHLFGPHNPYSPPPEMCRQVTAKYQEVADPGLGCSGDRFPRLATVEERPFMEVLYRAEVAETDAQLGRLLEVLEDERPGREPLLLVVSDHGEDFWQRQEHLAQGGYRADADHGHHYFQELLQVPGILRLPEDLPGSQVGTFEPPVILQDLFPTLLDLLDIEAPAPHQGQSLLPLLQGQPPRPRLHLFGPLLYGAPRQAVRKGPWKLVHSRKATPELYHLADDPEERHNQADAHPDIVQSLLELSHKELEASAKLRESLLGSNPGPTTERLNWKQLQRLRSLGYVQ